MSSSLSPPVADERRDVSRDPLLWLTAAGVVARNPRELWEKAAEFVSELAWGAFARIDYSGPTAVGSVEVGSGGTFPCAEYRVEEGDRHVMLALAAPPTAVHPEQIQRLLEGAIALAKLVGRRAELELERRRSTFMVELSRWMLAASTEPASLLRYTLDSTLQLASADAALIVLHRATDGEFSLGGASRIAEGSIDAIVRALQPSVLQVVETSAPLVLSELKEISPVFLPGAELGSLESAMLVPLRHTTRTIGALVVLRAFEGRAGPFTLADVGYVEVVASHIASGLELTQAIESAQRAAARAGAMVDGTPFPLALLSDSGSILQVNEAFRGLLGLDSEDIANTGSIQDSPLILNGGSWSDALRAADSRVPWRARVEVVRGGETRYCEGVVTPLADPDERHLLLALHDRTDEVRAQRELVTREKLATVGELAAGVAHEVNNPLATIRMEAELLGMAGADPETSQAVATILKEVDRAAAIAQGLLRLSRQSRDSWQGVSVNDLIADIVQIRSRVLRGHGVHLSARLEKKVPEVLGNAGDLQQVFVNLITNAEHAVASSEQPAIVLETSLRGAFVRVRVSDSGPGVDPEIRTRIFDPFFTTKDPDKGTGLGLALSQRIVSESGGSIWVETSELGGACFIVQLPVAGR